MNPTINLKVEVYCPYVNLKYPLIWLKKKEKKEKEEEEMIRKGETKDQIAAEILNW